MGKILVCLLVIPLLSLCAPGTAYAEGGRNIYVGDIVALKIRAADVSVEELTELFGDFEVVDIKSELDGYIVSLRTFEPGEYRVVIQRNEIVINVASTLDEIDRDGIFQGGTQIIPPGFSFYWRVPLFISAGVFGVCGGFMLVRAVLNLKKKGKPLSPYQLFEKRYASLVAEGNGYLVDLTRCFKEYIEGLFGCRIIGKTSGEILNELKGIETLDGAISDIEEWLTKCDAFKFAGIDVTMDEKQEHGTQLHYLIKSIEAQNTHAEKVGAT